MFLGVERPERVRATERLLLWPGTSLPSTSWDPEALSPHSSIATPLEFPNQGTPSAASSLPHARAFYFSFSQSLSPPPLPFSLSLPPFSLLPSSLPLPSLCLSSSSQLTAAVSKLDKDQSIGPLPTISCIFSLLPVLPHPQSLLVVPNPAQSFRVLGPKRELCYLHLSPRLWEGWGGLAKVFLVPVFPSAHPILGTCERQCSDPSLLPLWL